MCFSPTKAVRMSGNGVEDFMAWEFHAWESICLLKPEPFFSSRPSKALSGCGSMAGACLAPGGCPPCEIKTAERLGVCVFMCDAVGTGSNG